MRYDAVLIVTVFILGTMAIVLPPLYTLTGGHMHDLVPGLIRGVLAEFTL